MNVKFVKSADSEQVSHQDEPPLPINDVVLVVDEDLPRGQWPLGLIVGVITSEDGRVRSARVRVVGNERLRPTSKLVAH